MLLYFHYLIIDWESNLWNFLINLRPDHLQTGGGWQWNSQVTRWKEYWHCLPFYQDAGSVNTADLKLLKKRILCLFFSHPEIIFGITCQWNIHKILKKWKGDKGCCFSGRWTDKRVILQQVQQKPYVLTNFDTITKSNDAFSNLKCDRNIWFLESNGLCTWSWAFDRTVQIQTSKFYRKHTRASFCKHMTAKVCKTYITAAEKFRQYDVQWK